MLWVLLATVGVLVLVGVVFDVIARRRGAYRDAASFKEAGKQRRARRLHLMHTLYERRAGERPPPRRGR